MCVLWILLIVFLGLWVLANLEEVKKMYYWNTKIDIDEDSILDFKRDSHWDGYSYKFIYKNNTFRVEYRTFEEYRLDDEEMFDTKLKVFTDRVIKMMEKKNHIQKKLDRKNKILEGSKKQRKIFNNITGENNG